MERCMTVKDLFPWIGGSLTEILERSFQTRIHAQVLFHDMIPVKDAPLSAQDLELAGPPDEEPLIVRRVALCRNDTDDALLYAETLLVPHRCPRAFQHTLRTTSVPLGRVIQDARLRVWREHPRCDEEPTMLPAIFGSSRALVLKRSYRLWLADEREQPAMLITEWLPLVSEGTLSR